jgi:hypothetical protein
MKTEMKDYFGTPYAIGDIIEFQVLIGMRKHRSRSRVYGTYDGGILISCNGIRKRFRLKFGEVIRVIP